MAFSVSCCTIITEFEHYNEKKLTRGPSGAALLLNNSESAQRFFGTSTSSTEVCYLDTNIKTGENTPFRISIYDKRDDYAFRIVKFPHMDSNIPANPAYGVYISQLVRYARICTSKVEFINRLCGLSLRHGQQGFETNLLQKSFNKFFSRHGLIVEKYGAALREMRLAIQA